jgi:hypothetical protein
VTITLLFTDIEGSARLLWELRRRALGGCGRIRAGGKKLPREPVW